MRGLSLQLLEEISNLEVKRALSDLWVGLQRREIWATLAWQDIRSRYSRSLLGPIWITISMGVMVAALGVLYGHLMRLSYQEYVPYLALGFTIWALISSLIIGGCHAFISGGGLIKQLPMPLSVHIYRNVWHNLITFAHNIWIYVIAALIFDVRPGLTALLAVPGLILLSLNGVWVGLLFGVICTRFRDIPQITSSIIQVSFFLTPIIWKADQVTARSVLLNWNPFYYMVEVVRSPLLGGVPSLKVWLVVIGITVVGWLSALVFFVRYRWRIAYWV
jgi:ABC-2 type transport system permease protein/lipopolysaccharide transport system permease protein